MKNSRKKIGILCAVLAVILIAGLAVFFWTNSQPKLERSEKTVVTGYGSWPYYTFEEGVDKAATIVYGKVTNRGAIKDHVIGSAGGEELKEYYQEVSVEPITLIKGSTGWTGKITYLDFDVETDTHIYDTEGLDPLEVGKEYVLILSDRGAPLSPIMVIPVENGKLTSSFLPEEIEDSQKEMDVAEYLDLLKEAAQ